MNKIKSIVFAALVLGLGACNNGPSKLYQAMETEVMTIETRIGEATNCDELQMQNFAILGLRSDMDNLRRDDGIRASEIAQLEQKLEHLDTAWNAKWASMNCNQLNVNVDELDTSGEEDGGDF